MSTEDEILALKEATRQAHEVLKDLRHEIKEARRVQATLKADAQKAVAEGVADIVKAGLDTYMQIIMAAIEDATERVNARFDKLTEAFMGEDKANRRKGHASLPEIVEGLVAERATRVEDQAADIQDLLDQGYVAIVIDRSGEPGGAT